MTNSVCVCARAHVCVCACVRARVCVCVLVGRGGSYGRCDARSGYAAKSSSAQVSLEVGFYQI
jgi:hypothetical protein